jgi:hypothetical protein
MKPYFRVFRADGSEGSSHKIDTREEAAKFAETQCDVSDGGSMEIAMIVGLTMKTKAATFWMDGCVDTTAPGG